MGALKGSKSSPTHVQNAFYTDIPRTNAIPRTRPPEPPLPYEMTDKTWIIPSDSSADIVQGWNMTSDPAFYVPCPHSPTGLSMLSYLPAGLQALSFGEHRKISLPVATMIHRISVTDGLLNHSLPSPRAARNGKPIRRDALNATNLQEVEHLALLLVDPTLNTLEHATCVAMLNLLMDSSRSEQLSEVWLKRIQVECDSLLEIFNDIEQRRRMNEDELSWFAWVAIDIAGSMVPPRSFCERWPAQGGRGDRRLDLAVKVYEIYGPAGRDWTWEQMRGMLKQFFWTDGCVLSWKHVWELAQKFTEAESHR
jgi:hypothetical protein